MEVRDTFYQQFAALHEVSEAVIVDEQLTLRYCQLPALFAQFDHYLHSRGLSPNACVAVECDNTISALVTLLALLYRGQHILLLPPEGSPLKGVNFTPKSADFCSFHIRPKALFSAQSAVEEWATIYTNDNFQIAAANALTADLNQERLLLLRTSGSMGDSKIVCFSHRTLLKNAANCIERFTLNGESRVVISVPIFHLYGLGAALLPVLLARTSLYLLANSNIVRFLEVERRFAPDTLFMTPTLATMLLKGRRSHRYYKNTITAGAALSQSLYHAYQERFGPMMNLYGSTEMGAVATSTFDQPKDPPNYLVPLPGVAMQIEADQSALLCRHPYGFDRYVNSQGEVVASAPTLYPTGDLARWLPDGRIELLGRQSDSINRAGFLVQISDIESALLESTLLKQVAVISTTEETLRGPKLYAFCNTMPLQESEVTSEVIRQACVERLPPYAVPDEIILTRSLPLLASGKVDRKQLQQSLQTITGESQDASND